MGELMKKELCTLSKEDVQNFVLLMSNYYTFKTLQTIEEIKQDSQAHDDIQLKIIELEKNINDFKKKLLKKYDVPYYISTPMHIDVENGIIFVNE